MCPLGKLLLKLFVLGVARWCCFLMMLETCVYGGSRAHREEDLARLRDGLPWDSWLDDDRYRDER